VSTLLVYAARGVCNLYCVLQLYRSPALWNWQISSKWKFAYMDLVKSMASAAQGHQSWMLAWRCGSKLLREYASSMRKEHQIEVRLAPFFLNGDFRASDSRHPIQRARLCL
jgi:hypothetical protein